ncbi:MAG: hypothetical protein ACR2GD_13825 [Pyrinomonadaceae bacterium]
MFNSKSYPQLFLLLIFALFLNGCSSLYKTKSETARLLKTENASKEQLIAEVNRFARVDSIHAKMDLKFENNAYADVGLTEKFRTADGDVIVQRPSNIFLRVQVPLIKSDLAQMTSDGDKFRVAVLQDDAGGKYKKFVLGSNNADYSKLREAISQMDLKGGKAIRQNVSAFANMRPQHFTEALLVRPTDAEHLYVQSEIAQDEVDPSARKKSPTARVLRGYYLLDELAKNADGDLKVTRRFWFDRVGGIRLARQQIFDANGDIESDIVYGSEGNLSDNPDYRNLPLRVEVTRPKEKYKMSLTYQSPESVTIGKMYNQDVFVLKNSWNLPEVDLDKQAQANRTQKSAAQNANVSAQ